MHTRTLARDCSPDPFSPTRPSAACCGDVLSELGTLALDSLRRSDQRAKGLQYVQGLLTAHGRKTIRNIASAGGNDSAFEQGLHHFVASSTWDWMPVREALAGYLDRVSAPRAWVVEPMPIPKAGVHSVGVDRRFVPQFGQVVNNQMAFGLWFANENLSVPVDWRLYLPGAWLSDDDRRSRAEIPAEISQESIEACAVATALQHARQWGLSPRPVILDCRLTGPAVAVDRFSAAQVPFIVRIRPTELLAVADPAMSGSGRRPVPAEQILNAARRLRTPARWSDPADGRGKRHTTPVVTVGVTLPGLSPSRPLMLLGEWTTPDGPPAALWLTGLAAPAGMLLRLTRLTRRVSADSDRIGGEVGLREFEGRSYQGWHRHITLASLAHAAAVLTRTDRCTACGVCATC
ncbi:IS701 family transposase [Streptomyces sp. NBC_00454]|uniref:IS701 family transposase n=1 Tax=Streptomyces sp. NBC_00454 TaxID=2975747 RepID=UPI0030DE72A9